MTFYYVNIMWAIVLFGILLWTTACVVLNAALRSGMRAMGLALSYAVLVWMLIDVPWREALATWCVFAAFGALLTPLYELWARRKYAGTGRTRRAIVRVEGLLLWPALVPDLLGLMLNDAGIIFADDRSETHQEDTRRITAEMSIAGPLEIPLVETKH